MIKMISYTLFGFLYATIGVLAIWKKWFIVQLEDWQAYSLGVLFIVYGLFRIYRAVKVLNSGNY